MRADAARNRERLLTVAYEAFAAGGLSVPIVDIARGAGVGPGTIYRHFPNKESLFEAVIKDRVRIIAEDGRELLCTDPGTALFKFLRQVIRNGMVDHGLIDALSGYGIDIETAAPGAEASFLRVINELLSAGQEVGTVRADVGVGEIMMLMMVCKSTTPGDEEVVERALDVIIDGLRSTRSRSAKSTRSTRSIR
jgi:AcrR family transcriptional regulator